MSKAAFEAKAQSNFNVESPTDSVYCVCIKVLDNQISVVWMSKLDVTETTPFGPVRVSPKPHDILLNMRKCERRYD